VGVSSVLRRFFLFKPPASEEIFIEGEEYHHLKKVLRLKEGDKVELTDGQGYRYLAELTRFKKDKAKVRILKKEFIPPPDLKIHLGVSLLKKKVMDLVIQKATELGVWEINVCLTSNSVPQIEETERKVKRWQRIALEALKQCGRDYLPTIDMADFLDLLKKAQGLKLIAVGPREGAETIPLYLAVKDSQETDIWLFIGPEGGFSPEEIEQANTFGFIPVSFGPYILRAETAVLAGLSVIQAVTSSHH
jgi:16S rRNA (uracil1498-N3)-methyltransferase